MGHACELETAMMLHFRPDLVRRAEIKDDIKPEDERLRGLYVAGDFGKRTHRGAIGYPTQATAEKGKQMVDAVVGRVTDVCRALLEAKIEPGRRRRDQES
jgi:creatinine amidohydrolase